MAELIADVIPWFAAFYLLDAIVQLRRGQVVLELGGWAGFRLLRAGLHACALAPWGASLVTHDLPWLPAREGVWLFDPAGLQFPAVVRPESLRFVAWSDLGPVRVEGTRVKAGRRLVFRARSGAGARWLATQLEASRRAADPEREALWTAAQRAAFDVSAARERWERVRRPLAVTSAFGLAEASLLFLVLPYAAFVASANPGWERVLGALLWVHLGTVLAAGWTLARAGAGAGGVASGVLVLTLLPAYAARASAQVLREAFFQWEPVTIAAAVLPRAEFLRVARYEWVRAQASQAATDGLELSAFWEARSHGLEQVFAAAQTSVHQVLTPPLLASDAAAWCALCLGEYRQGFDECADCHLPLQTPDAMARGT